MRYKITHVTNYNYSSVVNHSNHILHLSPRQLIDQETENHAIQIDPLPYTRNAYIDSFGNPYIVIELKDAHDRFSVRSSLSINVLRLHSVELSYSHPWEKLIDELEKSNDPDIALYRCYSHFTQPNQAILDYARTSFHDGRPVLEAVLELTRRIFKDFAYDGVATDVSTVAADAFKMKRGVCQDFAHFQLAALRSLGLSARYVSGYIRTYSAKDEEMLVGSDATHAWISVWCPTHGWVDFDPTNNKAATDEHIALTVGRDFLDVSPINGVILGGGDHSVEVSVNVEPLDEAVQQN